MKQSTTSEKSSKLNSAGAEQAPSRQTGASIAPPPYGMNFLDHPGSASALQVQANPSTGGDAQMHPNPSNAVQRQALDDGYPGPAQELGVVQQKRGNEKPIARFGLATPGLPATTPVIQRLTIPQEQILNKFVQKLEISAAAALEVLAQSPTLTDFREVVKEMKTKDVQKLMQTSIAANAFGLRQEVQPYAAWLGEVRNERVASEAEKLAGDFNWVTSGVGIGEVTINKDTPQEKKKNIVLPASTGKNKNQERVDNDFTKWIRRMGPEPKNTSTMNCWEACLFSAYKAGVLFPWHLVNIYEIAKEAGQIELDKNSSEQNVIKAYTDAVAAVLGWGEERWRNGNPPPPRGYLVFFDGPVHVALSLGTLDHDGSPSVMSLWDRPGPQPKMQKTSIAKIEDASSPHIITFGPVPM